MNFSSGAASTTQEHKRIKQFLSHSNTKLIMEILSGVLTPMEASSMLLTMKEPPIVGIYRIAVNLNLTEIPKNSVSNPCQLERHFRYCKRDLLTPVFAIYMSLNLNIHHWKELKSALDLQMKTGTSIRSFIIRADTISISQTLRTPLKM